MSDSRPNPKGKDGKSSGTRGAASNYPLSQAQRNQKALARYRTLGVVSIRDTYNSNGDLFLQEGGIVLTGSKIQFLSFPVLEARLLGQQAASLTSSSAKSAKPESSKKTPPVAEQQVASTSKVVLGKPSLPTTSFQSANTFGALSDEGTTDWSEDIEGLNLIGSQKALSSFDKGKGKAKEGSGASSSETKSQKKEVVDKEKKVAKPPIAPDLTARAVQRFGISLADFHALYPVGHEDRPYLESVLSLSQKEYNSFRANDREMFEQIKQTFEDVSSDLSRRYDSSRENATPSSSSRNDEEGEDEGAKAKAAEEKGASPEGRD